MSGPVPKRSEERVRRNTDEPIERVEMTGPVAAPDLGVYTTNGDDVDADSFHPIAQDLYDSIKESGQAKFLEPSDWQVARVMCHLLSRVLWSNKPSSQMVAAVTTMMSNLLLTEGDRRRVRLEVDRNAAVVETQNIIADLDARMRSMKAPITP